MKYIFLALLITQISAAQYGIQYQDPKTPELYQFERYGNQPVSKYTGTPNVSIPLYNIKTGDIDINLALSYTSNGIRVDEEASQFGLGWYFGTGMISQTRQGKDDLARFNNFDENFQYTNVLLPPFYHSIWGARYITQKQPDWYWGGLSVQPPHIPEYRWPDEPGRAIIDQYLTTTPNNNLNQYFAAKISGDSNLRANPTESVLVPRHGGLSFKDYQYAINWKTHYEDASIDIFQANFFGHKISFYIKPMYFDKVEVINNEKYNVKFTRATLAETANVWCITTPDGIKYYFEEEKKTYFDNASDNYATLSIGTSSTDYKTHLDAPDGWMFGSESNNTYRTWKITRITDTKGNSVYFNYVPIQNMLFRSGKSGGASFYNTLYNEQEYYQASTMPNDYIIKNNLNISTYLLPLGKGIASSESNGTVTVQERSVLNKITFGTTCLLFNNSDRVDNPGDKKVDSLQIFSSLPLTDDIKNVTLIKQIDFNYDYFVNSSSTEDMQKRLKLNSILFDEKPYIFTYNSTELPLKDSVSFDFWGYYNGMPNATHLSNPLRLVNNISSTAGYWTNSLLHVIEGKANRSAHPDFCKAGILEKIQYPTGGSTEFVYELNEFNNYFAPDYNNKVGLNSSAPYAFTTNYIQTSSKGFGLRVKETIDRAANDGKVHKKKYEYSEGKHIPVFYNNTGDEPFKVVELKVSEHYGPYCFTSQGTRIISYHNGSYQSSFLGNGNFVGYNKVIEYEENEIGELNGKIVSFYTNVPDKSPIDVFMAPNEAYNGYHLSNYALFGQSIRNSDLDNGLLLKEEVYNNTNTDPIKTTEYQYDILLSPTVTNYNVNAIKLPETHGRHIPNGQNEPFIISEYIFFYYPLRMPRSILKEKTVKDYFNSGYVKSSTEYLFNSNFIPSGVKLKDSNGNIFYEENTTMMSADPYVTPFYIHSFLNIYNLPESKTIKKNGLIESITNYEYNFPTTLNHEEILPKGNNSSLANGNRYKFNQANQLEEFMDQSQIPTTVIYGYGRQLPIAKIQNISNSQLESIINIQALRDVSDTESEANLLLALNALRSNPALSNKMITTYTHKHLIGISTVTDPNGVTQYYDYDAFNRLKSVKDKDGNILSENEYHFKP